SPNNAVPYVSRVDAGTVELVKSCGVTVVSSANLVSNFESRLSEQQFKSHWQATENLRKIVFEAFDEIASAIAANRKVNEHSGRPHYQPTEHEHAEIKRGDFVLLDIWAKLKEPADAVYGDITWTGFVGDSVPEKYKRVFDIVSGARDAAVSYIRQAISQREPIQGWQVDDVTRNFINERGHGKDFIHRTGHSIGTEVHGNGANIDNLETQDRRSLIANTCFSIEPGVYLDEFGVRSEIDVYITDNEVIIGGQPIQTEVIPIIKSR